MNADGELTSRLSADAPHERVDGRPVAGDLATPARLREFFAPRSIAVVGASDGSGWARFVLASSMAVGYTGPLVAVHPVHRTVFGKPAVRSLRDLDEPVDLVFTLTPTEAVNDVIEDAAAVGVRNMIVLAAGYREVGPEGRALENAMAARAADHGILVLGPNCLGFLNTHARVAPFSLTVPQPLLPGPVGIALQSGALASVVLAFARAHAIGVSLLATMGNEAMISTTDVLSYLIEDDNTKAICLFLEEIDEPERFANAARRAERAGKPIVALKVGSSPVGRQVALAHTGSIAGDDAVIDGMFRQLNVIRVDTLEELLTTAALLGYDRWPTGRRMGVLTASGGACDLIADQANAEGIEIPPFAPETVTAIRRHVPPFATVHNPLDVTGYGLANPRTAALTAADHALDAALVDPGLDFVLFSLSLPDSRPPDPTVAAMTEERVAWLGRRLRTAPIPVIPVGSTCVDLSDYARNLLVRNGVHVLAGISIGVTAVGKALRWLEERGRARTPMVRPPATRRAARSGTWPETAARALLAEAGVPVVPAELVDSPEGAVRAARRVDGPVALKICSAQINHKSDIGGVVLGVQGDDAVRDAYRRVVAAGRSVPGARIEGVLVAPMRTDGLELLAGITRDPHFGPVLAVGLGGIWVEALADTSLRLLPMARDDVKQMLHELRGAPLLRGVRGGRPADMDVLTDVITTLSDVALSFGEALTALEINPLWVDGSRVEALDVLLVTG